MATTFKVERQQGPDGKEEYKVSEGEPLLPWPAETQFQVVGKPFPRLEGAEKVTGRARFSYDVRLPGQLYARVLRSPHPHARVKRVDTSKAAALPGVQAVISVTDAPEMDWYQEGKLFETTVRFAGDEVAAVAAESEELADDALRLIEVEYEPLPFVPTIGDALRPDAPHVHEGGNLAGEPTIYERGDAEAGLRQADVVVDATYETPCALHNALETHSCTTSWEGGALTLWDSTQGVFSVRSQVAEKLGLPQHRVRVITQHMGGGFGAKQIAWKHDVIAA